jgi:hypothetical protein
VSRLARIIVHAVIILALTQVLTVLAGAAPRPGIAMLLGFLLGPDHGLSFSISTALALNKQRALLFGQLFLTLLLLWPPHGAELSAACLPIAAGLAAGFSIAALLTESNPPVVTPALPPRIAYDNPRPTSHPTDERPDRSWSDRRAPRHAPPRDYGG